MLEFLQWNLNKSRDRFNLITASLAYSEVVFLQENTPNYLSIHSISSDWAIYSPLPHLPESVPRAITLFRCDLVTTLQLEQINFASPSKDIVIVHSRKLDIFFINIYVDARLDPSILSSLTEYLIRRPSMSSRCFISGDFNGHHPLWEFPSRRHRTNALGHETFDLKETFKLHLLTPF